MVIRIIPLLLSSLMLGAHFLRSGSLLLPLICLASPLLLLVRKSWSLAVVQAMTFMGAGVWLETMVTLANQRASMGAPWARMALILGAVAAFSVFAGWLLSSPRVKSGCKGR